MKRWFLITLIVVLTSCKQKTNHGSENNSVSLQSKEKREIGLSGTDKFTLLLEKSRIENKKIFLLFSFQSCAWCRVFEKYHNDSSVKEILQKYLIIKMIDVNKSAGGSDLYKTYGKIGFPSWAIIDSEKKVIIDSDDGFGNIGFPRNERDIEYYINAILKSAPSINRSECNILAKKLQEYGKR
jgi:thioredoxin-related protein